MFFMLFFFNSAKFPDDLLQLLLDNVCLLATSNTREIAGAALSYLKQFVYSFPTTTVGPYVPAIVRSKVFVKFFDKVLRKSIINIA